MALPDPRIVSLNELRFKPANSNERARAGLDHAFKEVPACSFAKDDGISPYMGSDAGIGSFPDTPHGQPALHDDVPQVAHEIAQPVGSIVHKLARNGFALSVFLHVVAVLAIGYYATVSLPDDTLLAGETVISLEVFSESEVDSQIAGEEEQVDAPEEKPVEQEIEKPVEEPKAEEKPVEQPPAEQAKIPEPVEEPVKPEEPVVTTEEPEVLATDKPSSFAVEQAARTILETTEIAPLPQTLPDELVTPPVEEKPEPKLAKPLPHPISKPRVVEKVAEAKPVEMKVEPKPVERKPEPKKEELKTPEKKVTEKAPEKKKPVEKSRKVKGNKGDNESESVRGTTNPKNTGKHNQDASQGGRKNRQIGNAAVNSYKGLVQRKLERAKRRVRVGAKGNVTVAFTITANGSITNLRIKKSSGKPAVDKGALDVVRKASPFPAIPSEARRSSWPMSVPMTFKGN